MADAPRRADAVWQGSLARGSGEVSLISSGAAGPLPVTWASRTERSNGKTSPEELLAAAHASCYCMALSCDLSDAGTPPEKLEVGVTVTFAQIEGGWKVGTSAITVKGTVPGLDEATFKTAAEAPRTAVPSVARSRATSSSAWRRRWPEPRRRSRRAALTITGSLPSPRRPRLGVRNQLAHEVRDVGHVRARRAEQAVHEALVQGVLRDVAFLERVGADGHPLDERVGGPRRPRRGSPRRSGCPSPGRRGRAAARRRPSRTARGACPGRRGGSPRRCS